MTEREVVSNVERVVYGLCPACNNWQLDAEYLEDPAVIEVILAEHDAEDHPGGLQRLATN